LLAFGLFVVILIANVNSLVADAVDKGWSIDQYPKLYHGQGSCKKKTL